MKLYHGTCSAEEIRQHGFDLSRVGENKGNFGAYGIGIYFTASEQVAYSYGTEVLVVEIPDAVFHDFAECCHLFDIDGPFHDPYACWELAEKRAWSEHISCMMLANGVKAVQMRQEFCVYDLSVPMSIIGVLSYWDYVCEMEAYK